MIPKDENPEKPYAKEKRLDTLLMSCYSIACHEKRHIVAMLKENRREKTGLDKFKAV